MDLEALVASSATGGEGEADGEGAATRGLGAGPAADEEEDPDRPMGLGLGFGGLGFTRAEVGCRRVGWGLAVWRAKGYVVERIGGVSGWAEGSLPWVLHQVAVDVWFVGWGSLVRAVSGGGHAGMQTGNPTSHGGTNHYCKPAAV